MRLATYRTGEEVYTGFVVSDTGVISLADAYDAAGLDPSLAPTSLLELIEREAVGEEEWRRVARTAEDAEERHTHASDVEWLPPVRPPKILGVAANNDGIARLASVCPDRPNFFLKPSSSLVGHGQPIVIRSDYGLTHPEAELAVVIGRRCKDLAVDDVPEAVFGYTIVNDVTSVTLKSGDTFVFPAPDVEPPPPGFEHGDMQLTYHARSKGTDTFGPCGPWIVTGEDIEAPGSLSVQVFMGEEECTTDNTGNLRYSVGEVISWASRFFTLEPGDIVHIGTAAGGKYALRELDFQSWDGPCIIEIERIGRLSNPIVRVDLDGNVVAAKPKTPSSAEWPPRYGAKR